MTEDRATKLSESIDLKRRYSRKILSDKDVPALPTLETNSDKQWRKVVSRCRLNS